jgi:hypothetical protein
MSSHRRLLVHWLLSAFVVSLVIGVVSVRAADAPAGPPLEGAWQGTLKASGIELRVVLKITKEAESGYKATLDSPDQGAKGIPFDTVTRDGNAIKLEAKKLRAGFEGTLSDDGRAIKGQWKQAGIATSLEVARLDKEPDYTRPQDPKKPYPYVEEEVAYENAAANVKLAGTLTLPKSPRPAPAVILITGSGAQDRDESIMGHRPFLVLADYLTRRGIAVLRLDDRGVGGSTGDPTAATTEDLTLDVLAGVAYLKTRREIDPQKIGLMGHSEGGIIAPLAASRSGDAAWIVLLAGTGVTGEEIIHRQSLLLGQALGVKEAELAVSRAGAERIFNIIKHQPDLAKAQQQVRDAMVELATAATPSPDDKTKKTIEDSSDARAKALVSPWFRFFLTYDPVPVLKKVRCPVLAINGQMDLQVDPKQNLPPIEAALKSGGNSDFTVKELPGLNHLFQHSATGSPTEYGKIDETIAPEALELVADWIARRAR